MTAGLAAAGAVSWATLALLLPVGAVLAVIGGQTGAIALGAVVFAAGAVVAASPALCSTAQGSASVPVRARGRADACARRR
jgi:hypothetical protein